jgi:hypothetical protein
MQPDQPIYRTVKRDSGALWTPHSNYCRKRPEITTAAAFGDNQLYQGIGDGVQLCARLSFPNLSHEAYKVWRRLARLKPCCKARYRVRC